MVQSGGMSSTHLNMARAICRRAERSVYPLIHAESVDAEVGRYLNRLSDFLFAATRAAALREGREELLWIKAVLPQSTVSEVTTAASVFATDSFNAAGKHPVVSALGNAEGNHTVTSSKSPKSFGGMDDDFFDPSFDTSVITESAPKPQKSKVTVGRDLDGPSSITGNSSRVLGAMDDDFFDPASQTSK